MARRDRVTRLKSHRRKTNKNPKLSPFQREQRRAKLANQAPILKKDDRDIPKSQRLVLEYLAEKQRRREAKKEEMRRVGGRAEEAQAQSQAQAQAPTHNTADTRDHLTQSASSSLSDKKNGLNSSLNAELASSLGPALHAFRGGTAADTDLESTSSIIARKKEKKHKKRVEARRERVKADIEKLSKDLEELKNGKRSKKKKDPNAAFEKELMAMQREKAAEDKRQQQLLKKKKSAAAAVVSAEETPNTAPPPKAKKSITFDASVEDTPTPAQSSPALPSGGRKRARDFSDLVDIVRFNERVEAPPVFNVVPNENASVTRLARRLESADAGKSTRHVLLSSTGGLGEQKRLSRLGLVPAATQLSPAAAAAQKAKVSKEKEMEVLRAHVMAAYQKKKRRALEAKKGVDMTHQFPSL
eukprot:gene4275-3092_t